jgi:hypothetical protein
MENGTNHLPPLHAVIQQELAAFDPPRDSGR